jgi:hypothetical protein
MRINGVQDVVVDLLHERVIVKFDAGKTRPTDLHGAILKSDSQTSAGGGLDCWLLLSQAVKGAETPD